MSRRPLAIRGIRAIRETRGLCATEAMREPLALPKTERMCITIAMFTTFPPAACAPAGRPPGKSAGGGLCRSR